MEIPQTFTSCKFTYRYSSFIRQYLKELLLLFCSYIMSLKCFYVQLLHVKWEFLKNVYAFLLQMYHVKIIISL